MHGKTSGQRKDGLPPGTSVSPTAGRRNRPQKAMEAGCVADRASLPASPPWRVTLPFHSILAMAWVRRVVSRLWPRTERSEARLRVVERLAVGPKQSLLLVEADGARLLIAHSGESTPALLALPGLTPAAPTFAELATLASLSPTPLHNPASGQPAGGGRKGPTPVASRTPVAPRTPAATVSAGRIQ